MEANQIWFWRATAGAGGGSDPVDQHRLRPRLDKRHRLALRQSEPTSCWSTGPAASDGGCSSGSSDPKNQLSDSAHSLGTCLIPSFLQASKSLVEQEFTISYQIPPRRLTG